MSEINWHPRCARCGKFVSYDADYYIPYGDGWSSEPPDPLYLCPKCVDEEIAYYRERKTMPSHYRTANWEEQLAKELGFEWSNNEVGHWRKKERER